MPQQSIRCSNVKPQAVKDVASQENQAAQVVQEPLENQVVPESQALQVSLAVHHEFAKPQLKLHANPAHQDHQERTVHPANQEPQANQEMQENPETINSQVHQDHRDHPDLVEMLDHLEPTDSLADLQFLFHQLLEMLDHLDLMDPLDPQVMVDQTEIPELLAVQDLKAHPDHQETTDPKDPMETKEPQAPMVNRESGEFVPNIAHWTEASSSKMGLAENKQTKENPAAAQKNILFFIFTIDTFMILLRNTHSTLGM